MAMTKKEREEFDAAIKKARIYGALRWTTKVDPDVPPPVNGSPYGALSKGFAISGWDDLRIEKACSSSIGRGIGRDDKTTSQNPMALYSTRIRALRAARNMLENRFAEKLSLLDAAIEDEEAVK